MTGKRDDRGSECKRLNDHTDEDQTEETAARHDHAPKGVAKRGRKKREAKPRYDSPAEMAVDGYGDPFVVNCSEGFVAFWVSEFDRSRMTRRRWTAGTWGDTRIQSYDGAVAGKKGEAIKHRELSLMIMRTEDAEQARRNDPRLKGREELREALWQRARSVGDGRGRTGRVEQVIRNISV